MKILYIITQTEWGGAQKYVFDLSTFARLQGHEVVVATGQGEDSMLIEKLTEVGIETHQLKNLVRNISLFKDIAAVFELAGLYRKIRPDIIHLNSSMAGVIGSFASVFYRRNKHRIVYTAHGWVFNEPMNQIKRWIFLFLERFSAKLKDKIICVSEFDRQVALKHRITPDKNLAAIHNGLDADKTEFLSREEALKELTANSKFSVPDSEIIIGTVANFYPTKGLDYLIKTTQLLITRYSLSVTLIIIGDGQLRPELEKSIVEKDLTSKILLAGKKNRASQYLKAFDVYACSSVKEGLPYSIMEAMAAERPVVTTDVGGIPEIIQDEQNGLLTEPANPRELADKLARLIKDRDLAKKLGAAGAATVREKFSKEIMVEKTMEVYNSLWSIKS